MEHLSSLLFVHRFGFTDLFVVSLAHHHVTFPINMARVSRRDLAARNVLLGRYCHAKIADFGLSRALASESDIYVVKVKRGCRLFLILAFLLVLLVRRFALCRVADMSYFPGAVSSSHPLDERGGAPAQHLYNSF